MCLCVADEGLTIESLLPVLEARGANSVRVTSLLEKRTELSSGFKGHYVGFSIPDKFVVGYCLDFNEIFRYAFTSVCAHFQRVICKKWCAQSYFWCFGEKQVTSYLADGCLDTRHRVFVVFLFPLSSYPISPPPHQRANTNLGLP